MSEAKAPNSIARTSCKPTAPEDWQRMFRPSAPLRSPRPQAEELAKSVFQLAEADAQWDIMQRMRAGATKRLELKHLLRNGAAVLHCSTTVRINWLGSMP